MTSSGGGPTDLDSPVRVVVDAVATHFRVALRDLGLTAPASTVGVALHPAARHGDDTVRVLVWCDPPDGAEIITADLPHGWAARSATEVAHLVAAVIATGLTRLASARGWDLGEALDIGRAAVEQEFGTGTEPWQVVAEGRGASAPEQPHEILIVGGGPGNGVPKAYLDELSRLLHIVAGDTWRAWWPHSPVKVAEVYYWFDAACPGVRVRQGVKVRADIDRPVSSMKGTNVTLLARRDVEALVARLVSRLGLPPPPDLM